MDRFAAEVAQRPLREADARQMQRSKRAYFRALARENLARLNAQREHLWDNSQHRNTPAHLRGIKPVTMEPWSRDAQVYAAQTNLEKVYYADAHGDGTVAARTYNDESILDSNNPDPARRYRSHVTASGLRKNASLGEQPLWDSSTRRYCPPGLKGIIPVTREPWAVDEWFYNRQTTRDTRSDNRAGGGALDLGSVSHASRAKLRQVDRAGFYMPNWEKWAASLSA